MFKLLRYFSITALVSLTLAAAALVALFTHAAQQDLLRAAERANGVHATVFANALNADLGDEVWRYLLEEAPRLDAAQLRAHPMTQRIHAVLRQLAAGTSVAKVKLFSPGGLTLYSSEAAQIGEDKHNVPLIAQAMQGAAASTFSQRDSFTSFDGQIFDRSLVSTYIPARRPGGAVPAGVFELYSDLTPLKLALDRSQRRQVAIVASVMAALFGVQWLIVRRGARIIRRQHDGLEAARRDVERARLDADQANAAKSRFLAHMSHEIRTPMHGVLGMTELLQATPLNEAQARYLQTIARSGEALLTILNDILDLSKIEAGKLVLDPQPFDLREAVEEVCDLALARAAAKGLALSVDLPAGLHTAVHGDALRLKQVLHNLVGNAIKFTRSGKIVVTLRSGAAPGAYRLSVSDTGVGIAPEVAARLFGAYEQADGTVARQFGGTGLGLAISRQLVELMGGRIGVRSTPGAGSEFFFDLQLAAAGAQDVTRPAALGDAVAADAAHGSGLSVLLVEDNAVNVLYAEAVLHALRCKVVIAGDGLQAIEAVRRQSFGLVLMDCNMPGMDGLEATPRIREVERQLGRPRTPIVALSASAMADERERCLAAGMDDFLPKPFQTDQLRELLRRWAPARV